MWYPDRDLDLRPDDPWEYGETDSTVSWVWFVRRRTVPVVGSQVHTLSGFVGRSQDCSSVCESLTDGTRPVERPTIHPTTHSDRCRRGGVVGVEEWWKDWR